jgi:hypothetical protein
MQLVMQPLQLQMRRLQMTMTRRTLVMLCWLQSALSTARSLTPSCKQVQVDAASIAVPRWSSGPQMSGANLAAAWQPWAAHAMFSTLMPFFAGPEGITQVELFKRMHLPIKKHAKRVRKLVEAAGIEVKLATLPEWLPTMQLLRVTARVDLQQSRHCRKHYVSRLP